MEEVPTLHVVLVEPEIHWNTGNIGRTCLAAGAQLHLVEPLGFSLGAREVRRSGLDYWPRVKPLVWPNWEAFEKTLPDSASLHFFSPDAERDYWSVTYHAPSFLVLGRESVGLPAPLRARYHEHLVHIPMQDQGLRSLNLSSCTAVALFEAKRQQRCLHQEP